MVSLLLVGCAVVPPPSLPVDADTAAVSTLAWTTPTLAEVPPEADDIVGVVDRARWLEGAVDAAEATPGDPPDLAAAAPGFRLEVHDDILGTLEPEDAGDNAAHAASLVELLELRSDNFLGSTRGTVAGLGDVALTEVGVNTWGGPLDPEDPDGDRLVTAWVGVGWLLTVETRTGADATEARLRGFLYADGQLGWWDLVDGATLGAVAEWAGRDDGDGQLGATAVDGPSADTTLTWDLTDEREWLGFRLPGSDERYWVVGTAIGDGEMRDPGWHEGATACWDTQGLDTPCDAG